MTVYLNGAFLPLANAQISVLDRGFLFGDGVYEFIPVYSRKPFRLDAHLARLATSLNAARLPDPLEPGAWHARVATLIAAQDFADQSIYVQVTRGTPGADEPTRDAPFPKSATPTLFMMANPLRTPSAATKASGVHAVSAPDNRWLRCDIKAVSLLPNVLLRQQAVDADCAETVLLRDGYLSEGTASSIAVVQNGVLLLPPKSNLTLPGITYDVVLELAARHGMPYAVRAISEAEVRNADELWLISSPKEVLAIVALDGVAVGDGRPGPLARQMDAYYQQYKAEVMRT
jgi:Branched-chain amino acid aminotransferase/4-amino-4-deoxychorismate lyase